MKSKLRLVLIFIVLALLAAAVTWKYTFRKSDTSVGDRRSDVEITVAMLVQAFESDEHAANAMYLDKIVTVTGTVESVTTDTTAISVYLKESDALTGVICSFDGKAAGISSLNKGMQVSIKGICTGYLMDVVMNRCSLVSGF